MLVTEIRNILEMHANEAAAVKMAAYMKDKFPFLGINAPTRKLLCKTVLYELRKTKAIDWEFVIACFAQPEREFQYVALDYLIPMEKYAQKADMDTIERLILSKSWWDTVDGIDHVAGAMVLKYPELINSHIRPWMHTENIWLRRVAIDHQLTYRLKTNTDLLSEAILANVGTKEFFINKAIGWSLREYSKWNSTWVEQFLERKEAVLSKLSIREARKYLMSDF